MFEEIKWKTEEGQTIQWPKEQEDKQRSTKHDTEN